MEKNRKVLFSFVLTGIAIFILSQVADAQNKGDVLNKGIPGNSSADLLKRIHCDVILPQPGLVVILVGTNDLLNTGKMVSVAEYTSNLEQITDSLLQHNIRVALVSPPTVDTLFLYGRHDASIYPEPPLKLLQEASDSLEKLCQRKNLLFINFFTYLQKRNIPRHNKDNIIRNTVNSGSTDGVHFTTKGNRLLAQQIFRQLKHAFGNLTGLKIICFGDSITYGVFMDGQGTSEGNTYPAFLKRLIRKEK